jgi:hypothetical protein
VEGKSWAIQQIGANEMTKILLGTIVGVFLGAFAVEMLKRKSPALLKSIEDKAAALADSVDKVLSGDESGSVTPRGREPA